MKKIGIWPKISIFFTALLCSHVHGVLAEGGKVIRIDGSSTVFPIAEAVVEEFQAANPQYNVTIGISGTGGGFKKFLAGEIEVVNASRPIKEAEMAIASERGIEFVELPIAYDALSIVVNPKNSWATTITVKELAKIWEPAAQGKILKWSDVRPDWPAKPLSLYGAGVDSGTFDYFTEAIVGKEDASRGDFTSSEDDNIIVKGVEGNEGALGFLGLAYLEANTKSIKAVALDDEKDDNGSGPQQPTRDGVINGQYQPLSRPLFVYVRKDALKRAEIQKFIDFYINQAGALSTEVGYIPLPASIYSLVAQRASSQTSGTLYQPGVKKVGVSLEQLLAVK
jgi:phosphate transport system substrate-binding protein